MQFFLKQTPVYLGPGHIDPSGSINNICLKPNSWVKAVIQEGNSLNNLPAQPKKYEFLSARYG